jgi:iron(III) transport system substrate-binding protein
MNVQWVDGGAVAAQEVAAGAAPMSFPMYPSHTVALEAEGAPIEIVHDLDPTQGLTTTVALSADAPNPNAARVFANWLASEDGRNVLCTLDVYSAIADGDEPCPDVPSNYVPAVYGLPDEEQEEILSLLGLED